jgi:DNA replication and repair protein RecF
LKFKKEGRKEILLNSNPVNDRKELILSNPCIVFSNNDMQLITGAPKIKRRFFNQTISLVDIFFIDLLRRYNTLLKNRNILLKEKRYNLLPVYDKQLSKEGLKLQSIRNKTIHSFNETFTQVYQDLTKSDRSMRIIYKPGWKNIKTEDEAEDLLKKTIERDKMLLFTSSGPHRDNIQYYLDGEDYTQFASTGQIRLLSLILKLSQAVFFNRIKKKRVILLLDDVLLELDPEKKQSFFNILPPYEQAFFTFLPDEKYLNYANKDTKLYLVQNGNITEWKKQAIS